MRNYALIIMFVAAATVAQARRGAITPEAMTTWKIVCDPAATEAERYAAAEFQRLFKAMTAVVLPIVDAAPSNEGAVFIGPDAVSRSGQTAAPRSFGEEELRIRVGPKALCIDGGRPRGTLYGVYEFFEEQCGVRFLTFDDTYYPKNAASRRIPFGTHTFNPTFAFRWSYYGENSRHPAFAARLHINTVSDDPKLGGRTGYRLVSHNVAYLVPPAKYGKAHPEYYALVDGKRRLHDTGGGPQLCMSNPDLVDVVVKAVRLENAFWRVVVLPGSNGKVAEMAYKPTGRNIVNAPRSFSRFRHEEWARQGEGPAAENIVAFDAKTEPGKVVLSMTTKDGARLQRSITLKGDAVRFETTMTAKAPRPFEFLVHPEYDTATRSDDPDMLCVYVKHPGWVHANRLWRDAIPTDRQKALIKNAIAGGDFAYYNQKAKFGVEQRFDPADFSTIELYWSPGRQQINLQMTSKSVSLEKGQQAHYAYEVRYLKQPPQTK